MLSTFILLVTYVSVAIAVVAFAGTQWLSDNAGEEEFVFAYLADEVLGGWNWVLLVAVATSAIASTQTTIIPASRTGLSMARRAAIPARFGHIHPGTTPPTSAPGPWRSSRSPGTSASTRSVRTRCSTR